MLHSSAFGIYMLSTVGLAVGENFYMFALTEKAFQVYLGFYLYWILSSFAAQTLLVVIFWQLGTLSKETVCDDQSESFKSVKAEEFDEEAELTARIWNNFNRRNNTKLSDGSSNVWSIISATQIQHFSRSRDSETVSQDRISQVSNLPREPTIATVRSL